MEIEERVKLVLNALDNGNRIIVLDGPCASGKTTIASIVSSRRKVSVVHMDDFFLPLSLRSPERFKKEGGNVHWERFIDEVIIPLKRREDFSYRVFSCSRMDYIGEKQIDGSNPVIIEGSYSMHPEFNHYWDKAFFLTVDKDEQLRRLEKRCPEKLEDFKNKWIVLENDYFSKTKTKDRADIVI